MGREVEEVQGWKGEVWEDKGGHQWGMWREKEGKYVYGEEGELGKRSWQSNSVHSPSSSSSQTILIESVGPM